MVLKRFVLLLVAAGLLFIVGCKNSTDNSNQKTDSQEAPCIDPKSEVNSATGVNLPTSPEISLSESSMYINDNSIDRAFTRIVDERRDELSNNTVLAYLYASIWLFEFEKISHDLISRELLFELPDISWKHEATPYKPRHSAWVAARQYANDWSGSNSARAQLEEIARYYKIMVNDCLARCAELDIDINIQSDEDELYQFLSDFYSYQQVPYEEYRSKHQIESNSIIPMLIVGAIPGEDIHIAFAPPFGIVLTVYGEEFFYTWVSGELLSNLEN